MQSIYSLLLVLASTMFLVACDVDESIKPDLYEGLELIYEAGSSPSSRPAWLVSTTADPQEGKYCNGCTASCTVLVSPAAPNGQASFETSALSPSECIDWAVGKCGSNLIRANCSF